MAELERRLASAAASAGTAGAGARPPDSGPGTGTSSRLSSVRREDGREAKRTADVAKGTAAGERSQDPEAARAAAGARRPPGSRRLPPSPAPPPARRAPSGPASAFEALADEQVAQYLVTADRGGAAERADPTTRALLEAAEALSQQQITEPVSTHGLIAELSGVGALADSLIGVPRGYEHEEPWLRVLAQVRDVISSLGGVVGVIGLACTVTGLILSLLVPPVGAFLLTVGRVCDVLAPILDAISLALGIVLTGYNLYRLKNATDPKARERLLALVRQDAMKTVMSGISVATAVAPGVGRSLAATGPGQAARTFLSSAMARGRSLWSGSRLGGLVAAGRTAATGSFLGRTVSQATGAVGGFGRRGLVAARDWRPVRWANRVTSQMEERARDYFRQLATRDTTVGRFYRRRVRGFHERNVQVARSVNDPIERQYNLGVGNEMRAHFDQLRGAGISDVDELTNRLRQRFGDRTGDFRIGTTDGGAIGFVRNDAMLPQLRAQEFTEIQIVRDLNPGAAASELSEQLNRNPFIKGRWTAEEVQAFIAQNPSFRDGGGALIVGSASNAGQMVRKTPHHTIPAHMAPQIQADPRFMQLANDPRSPAYRSFVDLAYPPGQFQRPPRPRTVQVPDPVTGTLRRARNERELMQGLIARDGIVVPNPPNPHFFESDQFVRELQEQGSTGAWTNPRNPAQRYLFNPHFVIGHGWDFRRELARNIFDLPARLGLQGEAVRQLLGPGLRQWIRPGGEPGSSKQPTRVAALPPSGMAAVDRALLAGSSLPGGDGAASPGALPNFLLGAREQERDRESVRGPTTAGGGASPAFLALLTHRLATPAFRPAGLAVADGAVGATRGLAEAPREEPIAALRMTAPPPEEVPYSPGSLLHLRESRAAIADAIQAVEAYIAATQQSQRDNELAGQAAALLRGRSDEQRAAAAAERRTVSADRGKVDQAGGAERQMTAETDRAAAQSERGTSQGERVQGEGAGVTVEAKPEEPDNRSWLERAWDATAGALWDALVQPVIDAARRKISTVMESINKFITDMINQALGLDEIEAELAAGGVDIEARKGSLETTAQGLEEQQQQADDERQRNQATQELADANIAEARGRRSEAEQILTALVAHYQALGEEEEAAAAFVGGFGNEHREYFRQQETLVAERQGGGTTAAAGTAPEPAGDVVDGTQVAPVVALIDALAQAEAGSEREMVEAAAASAVAIAPAVRDDEAEVRGGALSGFRSARAGRAARIAALRREATGCIGQPLEGGLLRLQRIGDAAFALAEELEGGRTETLQALAAPHQQAVAGAPGGAGAMEGG